VQWTGVTFRSSHVRRRLHAVTNEINIDRDRFQALIHRGRGVAGLVVKVTELVEFRDRMIEMVRVSDVWLLMF